MAVREMRVKGNLIGTKGRILDGWPMRIAIALYCLALVLVALTLASGILVV